MKIGNYITSLLIIGYGVYTLYPFLTTGTISNNDLIQSVIAILGPIGYMLYSNKDNFKTLFTRSDKEVTNSNISQISLDRKCLDHLIKRAIASKETELAKSLLTINEKFNRIWFKIQEETIKEDNR